MVWTYWAYGVLGLAGFCVAIYYLAKWFNDYTQKIVEKEFEAEIDFHKVAYKLYHDSVEKNKAKK